MSMDNALAAGRGGSTGAPALQNEVRRPTAAAQRMQADAQRPQIEPRRKTIVERVQVPAPILKHSFSKKHDPLGDNLTGKTLRCLQRIPNEARKPALKQAEALRKTLCARRRPRPVNGVGSPLDAFPHPSYIGRNGFSTPRGGVLPLKNDLFTSML